MDFGGLSGLDDSLFESKEREVVKISLTSYNAKFCEPYWFSSSHKDGACDSSEAAFVNKFSGDFEFRQMRYQLAMKKYQQALKYLLSPSSSAIRRDLEEAIVRCNMKLGNSKDAEELAKSLHQDSQNYEQKSNTLKLLIDVYKSLDDVQGELLHTQQLAALHPLNSDVWMNLADLYSLQDRSSNRKTSSITVNTETSRTQRPSDTSSFTDTEHNSDVCPCDSVNILHITASSAISSNQVHTQTSESNISEIRSTTHCPESQINTKCGIKSESDRKGACNGSYPTESTQKRDGKVMTHLSAYTCLMRALLVLKSVEHSVASFVKHKNEETQKKLSDRIAILESDYISADDKSKCLKFLTRDVFMEQSELDSVILQEADIDSPTFQEKFEKKWFSWTTI